MNIKTGRYRNAGLVTAGSASRFGIGDAAHLPDSDAGTDLAGCFRAGKEIRRREETPARTVSMKTALAIIAVVLFVFGSVTVSKYLAVRSLQERLDSMAVSMERTRADNAALRKEVESARDLSRIGYIAVNQLGMVASDDGNTVVMIVPQILSFAGSVERELPEESARESADAADENTPSVAESGRAGR